MTARRRWRTATSTRPLPSGPVYAWHLSPRPPGATPPPFIDPDTLIPVSRVSRRRRLLRQCVPPAIVQAVRQARADARTAERQAARQAQRARPRPWWAGRLTYRLAARQRFPGALIFWSGPWAVEDFSYPDRLRIYLSYSETNARRMAARIPQGYGGHVHDLSTVTVERRCSECRRLGHTRRRCPELRRG
jgi:hypothetical protein